jgi:hypothetical protein
MKELSDWYATAVNNAVRRRTGDYGLTPAEPPCGRRWDDRNGCAWLPEAGTSAPHRCARVAGHATNPGLIQRHTCKCRCGATAATERST